MVKCSKDTQCWSCLAKAGSNAGARAEPLCSHSRSAFPAPKLLSSAALARRCWGVEGWWWCSAASQVHAQCETTMGLEGKWRCWGCCSHGGKTALEHQHFLLLGCFCQLGQLPAPPGSIPWGRVEQRPQGRCCPQGQHIGVQCACHVSMFPYACRTTAPSSPAQAPWLGKGLSQPHSLQAPWGEASGRRGGGGAVVGTLSFWTNCDHQGQHHAGVTEQVTMVFTESEGALQVHVMLLSLVSCP